MSRTSHPVRRRDSAVPYPVRGAGRAEPRQPGVRPDRRRRPQNASWAYVWSIDLLSRRFFADVVLPVATVLLLVAAVAGAVGLTYIAL